MAFPFTFNPSDPQGTVSARLIDDKIREFKQQMADIFGIPTSGSMTGPAMTITRSGKLQNLSPIKDVGPNIRFIGTETGAKDVRIMENAGSLIIYENTGTEDAPTWTQRFTFTMGADGELRLPSSDLPATNEAALPTLAYTTHRESSPIDHPDGSITGDKIASLSIDNTHLKDGSVVTSKIYNGAVTGAKIAAGTITDSNIATATITGSKIANDTIGPAKLAEGITILLETDDRERSTTSTTWTNLANFRIMVPSGVGGIRFGAWIKNAGGGTTYARLYNGTVGGACQIYTSSSSYAWVDSSEQSLASLAGTVQTFSIQMYVTAGTGYIAGVNVWFSGSV